jgi:hypothetical protein
VPSNKPNKAGAIQRTMTTTVMSNYLPQALVAAILAAPEPPRTAADVASMVQLLLCSHTSVD